MFHTLVASGPQTRSASPRLFMSVALHGVVIAAAVGLTRHSPPLATVSRAGTPIPLIAPRATPRPSSPALHRAHGGPLPTPIWAPDGQMRDLSVAIPTPTLPGVTNLLDNLASQTHGRPEPPGLGSDLGAEDGDPWTATSVDDPIAVIEQPTLTYPSALAHTGISGRVELEYVVDTLGRAEPGSVKALVSTRPEFEAAARVTVLASRYRPARLRGRLVRQLVRQTLSFQAAP